MKNTIKYAIGRRLVSPPPECKVVPQNYLKPKVYHNRWWPQLPLYVYHQEVFSPTAMSQTPTEPNLKSVKGTANKDSTSETITILPKGKVQLRVVGWGVGLNGTYVCFCK